LDRFLKNFGTKPYYLELKVPAHRSQDEAYTSCLFEAVHKRLLRQPLAEGAFLASFHAGILEKAALHYPPEQLAKIYEAEAVTRGFPQGESKGPWGRVSIPYSALETSLHYFPPINTLVWDLKTGEEMKVAMDAGVGGLCADNARLMLKIVGDRFGDCTREE
jgi:glycerophosphoryl diester phosphodiesterase